MATLTGRVLYPGDPGWDEARKVYNQRFSAQPQAIVFCQNTQDVVNALRWALDNDVPFRVRSGRHSYEGYSLVENGLVIDLGDIDHVSVDRQAMTACVGAGNYMLRLSEWLGEVGVTIPLATGPTVGIGGLTLGGGVGLTSRKLGLTCDNLLSATVVLASGDVVTASADVNPDLFWALRGGGGGNFGIVTEFVFKVHPVSYAAAVVLEWEWEHFEPVVAVWQNWAFETDDDLAVVLQLTAERKIKVYGLYVPDDPTRLGNVQVLLQDLLSQVPPPIVNQVQAPLPYLIASRVFFAQGSQTVDPVTPMWPVHAHTSQQIFKSTSTIATKPLNRKAIQTIKQFLENVPPLSEPPIQPSMLQLLPGGGAPNRVKPKDTAVYLRSTRCILQYDGYWQAQSDGPKTIEWVNQFRSAMLKYTQGAYVNYVDGDIQDYLEAYYGGNLKRLVEVKKKYDPDNVFNFPQSIPVELPRGKARAVGRNQTRTQTFPI